MESVTQQIYNNAQELVLYTIQYRNFPSRSLRERLEGLWNIPGSSSDTQAQLKESMVVQHTVCKSVEALLVATLAHSYDFTRLKELIFMLWCYCVARRI